MIVNDSYDVVKAGSAVGESTSSTLVGFETRYGEAQRKAAEARLKRKTSGGRCEVSQTVSDAARFRQEAIELRLAVRDRLENGYTLPFGQNIAGRWRQPFVEEGLRSEDNPILKLFVTLVPKGGRARASNDKAILDVQSRSKLLTLDYPYIELNKEFLGAIRIDCDGVFASPDHLLLALEELVREGKIPCLPHIIVGDLRDDGIYHRPHFIFLLPPGTAVWKSDDKRCRRDIVRLFLGVSNGLTKVLLPFGADPAAPATTMRMKNPLSPIWHTVTPNRHDMPALSAYANWVDTGSNREALVRQAAAVQSRMGLKASNVAFNTLRDRGKTLLIQWHFAADARMKGSKAALADHLHVALEDYARTMELEDTKLSYVIAKVADRLAMDFDPAKLQGGKNRQRLLHVVEGMTNVRDRQRAGAEYAQGIRRDRSLEKLVAAYSAMLERSETLSLERLASRAGVSRSSAYRHLTACQQICANGCIDKKVGIAPRDKKLDQRLGEMVNGETQSESATLESPLWQARGVWGTAAPEAHGDDLSRIEEQATWIVVQEERISGSQTNVNTSAVSDIIFNAHPYLKATETVDSAMREKGHLWALA
ncbi:hypothetical protein [Pararhizobium sp. DWP3-4]|uniref:hypothetical protein n=1 Tax=Pararhizobium sp. DWP3-4 TaxID=2804565 RepID=UPI003CEA2218